MLQQEYQSSFLCRGIALLFPQQTYDGRLTTQRVHVWHKLPTGELKRTLNVELWTFNTEHIQEGETNSRIDNRRSDRIVIIIIIFIIINVNIIIIIILIIREDTFSLCECACLEKKIFKGLHQIFYVQIVFGYYFATYVCGPTIWRNFDYTYPKTICI